MSSTNHDGLGNLLEDGGIDGLVRDLAGPGLHAARIAYGKQNLTLAVADRRAMAWARLYLEPILTFEDAEPEDARFVCLFTSAERLAELVAGLAWQQDELLIHFRKRASIVRHAGFVCVHDTDAALLYVIEPATGRIVSIGVPSPVNLRDPARQSRELLLGDALADGWVILHASAVVQDGRGWIFAGDKGSGKTTLAVAALSSGRKFEYLANDRLLARADADGRVILRPYAISVRLGGGTLRNHPRLRAHLHPFDHFDAAILPLEDQFAHDDKLELTVGEYAEILDCAVAEGAVLERIILPTMDFQRDPQGASSSAVVAGPDRAETEALLHSCLMIPDPDGTGWLRGLVSEPDELTDSMRHTMRIMADAGVLRLRGTPQAMLAAVLAEDTEAIQTAGPTWQRAPLRTEMVAVTDHRRTDRALKPASWQTRAVSAGSVHELLVIRADADTELGVDDVSYLGFASFGAGLLAVGDTLMWKGKSLAAIAGFDDTHQPNHMNVILRAVEGHPTGCELGLQPGDELLFEPRR